MLVISLYWHELTPSFLNQQEVSEKLQKQKNARKTWYIYVFRGLRGNHSLCSKILVLQT